MEHIEVISAIHKRLDALEGNHSAAEGRLILVENTLKEVAASQRELTGVVKDLVKSQEVNNTMTSNIQSIITAGKIGSGLLRWLAGVVIALSAMGVAMKTGAVDFWHLFTR